MLRRSAKIPGEPDDVFDIRTLRMPRKVADLHILDQPTTKRAHGQLLCEMDSATWRPHIVSRLSWQASGGSGASPPTNALVLKKRCLNHRIIAKRFSPMSFIGHLNGGSMGYALPLPSLAR